MSKQVVFDVTGHGFGHAAMSFPVVEALEARRPDIRFTVRSSFPEPWIRARLRAPFEYRPMRDFGMAMTDGLRVDAPASLAYYLDLHARWDEVVGRAALKIRAVAPDLLVSNVSYVSLEAAKVAGVDAVAYSSLNWADVFWAYCADMPGAAAVRARMARAYAATDLFLQPAPSMPMPSIHNGRATSPVTKWGSDRSREIKSRMRFGADIKIALLSMGGIPTPIATADWPSLGRWRVILGSDERPSHPHVLSWAELDMSFVDCLASSDAAIIKPGYGLITESVCHARPLLYVPRDEWPETQAQLAWAAEHGAAERLDQSALRAGTFVPVLDRLVSRPTPPPPNASGASEIADILLARM